MKRLPVVLRLAAIVSVLSFGAAGVRALDDFGRLPDFDLTRHDGTPFTAEALDGRIWIADFIFTRCKGQCPLMSSRMLLVRDDFAKEPGVRFVSFTVDPEFDTPEVLTRYAEALGAGPNWSFVTGELSDIRSLAEESFMLGFGEGGPEDEPILHSSRFVLVGPNRHVRGYYSAFDEEAQEQLRRDIRRLLDEQE